MIWVRRGAVTLLSLILLISLLGAALFTSFHHTVAQPRKVETYLAESHLYDHFVSYVAGQAAKSEGDQSTGTVSLNDAAVQAAARAAFPAPLIQKGVNSFINANYAWLEGKTAIPEFSLNLSGQKADFAKRVGKVVKAYTATLPTCTSAEAVREQIKIDPLSAVCRPAGVSPSAVGAQVTQRLSTTDEFLSSPVLTAASVNPQGNLKSNPYYVKASKLPKAYRAAARLPFAFGILAILSALGVIFISQRRRIGLAVVGAVAAVSGILLLASKPAADFGVEQVEKHVFNSANVGPLQRSLTDFADKIASSLVRTNVWFGIAFLLAAILILCVLLATRRRGRPRKAPDSIESPAAEPDDRRLPAIVSRKRFKRPFGDSIMPLGAKPGGDDIDKDEPEITSANTDDATPAANTGAPAGLPTKPKRRKRPRLIQ